MNVVLRCDGDDRIFLTVEDNGAGIASGDLDKIFHRFFRGDQSRSLPGSGLGLSLVQAVVRAHGGEIRVQSNPRKGTRFTLSLPAVKPP